jgi:hypothetical protein
MLLRTRCFRPPKGSFPSAFDHADCSFPGDGTVTTADGSFPGQGTITTEFDKIKPRKRKMPTYSMATKYRYLKTCFKRRVHPSQGSRSTSQQQVNSFEWSALMGSPSMEEDEVPLMDFVDECKDGYYY